MHMHSISEIFAALLKLEKKLQVMLIKEGSNKYSKIVPRAISVAGMIRDSDQFDRMARKRSLAMNGNRVLGRS